MKGISYMQGTNEVYEIICTISFGACVSKIDKMTYKPGRVRRIAKKWLRFLLLWNNVNTTCTLINWDKNYMSLHLLAAINLFW